MLSKIQTQADLETSRTEGSGKTLLDAMALDEPGASGDTLALILQEIRAKLGNQSLKSAAEGLKATGDAKEAAHQERMDKLKEAAEAQEKAKESGLIGKIFGWIGAALAVLAAIAVAVVTFGAAAPASGLAIAGVIAAMTGAALGATTQIVTSIPGAMESMGKEGSEAFMWTMMALQIAAAAVSIGAGLGSAASLGSNAGGAAATSADDVAQTAAAASKWGKLGSDMGNATRVMEGANMVGQGTNQIVGAHHQHDADMARADAKEFAKLLAQLQALQESETEFVEGIVKMLDEASSIVAQIASDTGQATQTIVRNA